VLADEMADLDLPSVQCEDIFVFITMVYAALLTLRMVTHETLGLKGTTD
jgi:hypothetical protein